MKVLLDECVVQDLRHLVVGHDVFTVGYLGWTALANGDLLAQAVADGFEAFVSTDRNVRYQQHVTTIPIAVIVLVVQNNDMNSLKPLVPSLLATLNHVQPGTVTELRA